MSRSTAPKAPIWIAAALGASAIVLRVVIEVNRVKDADPSLALNYLIAGLAVLAGFAAAAAAYVTFGFRSARRWRAWADDQDGAFVVRSDKPTELALGRLGMTNPEGYFGVVLDTSSLSVWFDSKKPRRAANLHLLEPLSAGQIVVLGQLVPIITAVVDGVPESVTVPLPLVEPRFGMFYSLRPGQLSEVALRLQRSAGEATP